MNKNELKNLLADFKNGTVSEKAVVNRILTAPFVDTSDAKIDTHRELRKGAAEVIYGEGKTARQIMDICSKMLELGDKRILITRVSPEKAAEICLHISCEYYENAGLLIAGGIPERRVGNIAVLTGGTSDLHVAEEAALTCEFLGNHVKRIYDVGVAGVHRLLSFAEDIFNAKCIIAVAGMEGALASVAAGIAPCPVIAVPTSVGYGASFGGLTAFLAMVNSCASGVSVVNIDNGFGAGYQASLINHIGEEE